MVKRERNSKGQFVKSGVTKKLNMTEEEARSILSKPLMMTGDTIIVDMKDFAKVLMPIVTRVMKDEVVIVGDIKLISGTDINMDSTIDELARAGVPLLDYFLYRNLVSQGKRPQWDVDQTIKPISVKEWIKSAIYLVYMGYTRAKWLIGEGESLPKFVRDSLKFNYSKTEIKNMLTNNDLSCFSFDLILQFDLRSFGTPFVNRLKSGIAGNRQMMVFKNYAPDTSLDDSSKRMYEFLKKKAENGPWLDLHPMFQSPTFASLHFNKNIENFIVAIYSEKLIDQMVKDKALYSKPKETDKFKMIFTWAPEDLSMHFTKKLLSDDYF